MAATLPTLCLVIFEDITSLPYLTNSFHEIISDFWYGVKTETDKGMLWIGFVISKNI